MGKFRLCAAMAAAIVLAGRTAIAADLPSPEVSTLGIDTPKKILFVGNSYFYYGDSLHNHVRRIARANDPENTKSYKYKSATISGASLHQHDVWAYLQPRRLRVKGPFDIVVLQGGSGAIRTEKRRMRFARTVKKFDRYIRSTGAKTALYMTHAYVKPHRRFRPGMIEDLVRLYVDTANEVGALVIPAGLAFEEAYRLRPKMKLHKQDGTHPSILGTYLAACVVYASLYDRTTSGHAYTYFGKVDPKDAAFLQKVADDTVRKFLRR